MVAKVVLLMHSTNAVFMDYALVRDLRIVLTLRALQWQISSGHGCPHRQKAWYCFIFSLYVPTHVGLIRGYLIRGQPQLLVVG